MHPALRPEAADFKESLLSWSVPPPSSSVGRTPEDRYGGGTHPSTSRSPRRCQDAAIIHLGRSLADRPTSKPSRDSCIHTAKGIPSSLFKSIAWGHYLRVQDGLAKHLVLLAVFFVFPDRIHIPHRKTGEQEPVLLLRTTGAKR